MATSVISKPIAATKSAAYTGTSSSGATPSAMPCKRLSLNGCSGYGNEAGMHVANL